MQKPHNIEARINRKLKKTMRKRENNKKQKQSWPAAI